jgi:hypothetical protein
MKHFVSTLLFIGLSTLFGVGSVFGASSVETKVSVSASTGSNSVSNGVTKVGTSEANVFIETVVGGKVVDTVNEHVVSDQGEPVTIERQLHYEINSDGEESYSIESELGETSKETKEGLAPPEKSDEKPEEKQLKVFVWVKKLINYVISLFKSW